MFSEPSAFEPLDLAIIRQLRATPGMWTNIDVDAMAHVDSEAIVLLSRAGMIEGRCRLMFELDDLQETVLLVVAMCGETRNAPIVQSTLYAAIPRHWIGADNKVKFHLRFISEGFHAVRRTDQGELAIIHLATVPGQVVDFVRHRNFFTFAAPAPASFRIESREFKQQQSGSGPSTTATASAQASVGDVYVNVSNNIDLSGLAQILADLMQRPPTDYPKRGTGRKKAGRPSKSESDSTTKVLAGLTMLHGYENGAVVDLDPRSVAEIAAASGTSEASVSRALCDIFGVEKDGYKAYGIGCHEKRLGAGGDTGDENGRCCEL